MTMVSNHPAMLRIIVYVSLSLAMAGGLLMPACGYSADDARITVPAAALAGLLADMSPLPLGPFKGLEGQLALGDFKNLQLVEKRLSADVHLSGRELRYTVNIGGTGVVLDVGSISIPLHVDLGFRLDVPAQKIWLTPTFRLRSDTPQQGEAVQPILDLLTGESYVLDPAQWSQAFNWTEDAAIRLNMRITDLFTAKNKLFIAFQPQVHRKP